ncbi:MAG: pyridoxamine 5'-phosphate oxidase family protein [Acidimicrobiales bacterium]
MTELADIAPAFVAIAHRIVWCTVATVAVDGRPRTRILHPIWEWDGTDLTGWIATSPQSPKAADLEWQPAVSLTYWDATHDIATADCDTKWETTDEQRRAGWDRFAHGPAPVGYDPSIIPAWTSPDAPAFGILRLVPNRLRVMPGSVLLAGQGEVSTWRR